MKSDCETEKEYSISKRLLLHYVDSNFFKESLGDIPACAIMHFMMTNFFVHEDKFFFYKRKDISHFDEYTNSCGEGKNNDVKNSSIGAKPNISNDKASSILVRNGKISSMEHMQTSSKMKLVTIICT